MISQAIKDGIRDGTAIGLSAGVLGLMYSLAALEVGLRPLEIIFYCAIVYSAAVQFTAFGADLNSAAAVLRRSGRQHGAAPSTTARGAAR